MQKKLLSLLSGLLFFTLISLGQNKTITGKITDTKGGTPITGVTITVNGQAVGASNADGTFSVSVPAKARTFVLSSVGYSDLEIPIETGEMAIKMAEGESKSLSEVVVTGYSTIQRKKYSGSTVNVNIEDIRTQTLGSFDQALQGGAPGVSVVANSGQPGRAGEVRIRGNGSINGGNNPLYILDGIQINAADFSSLNQGDFERVEILKDATATAIYGSRGANGVIVITTRKGKAGQMKLNYDAQVGFSTLPEDRITVMNSNQKIQYELDNGNPFGWSPAVADSLRQVNTNWKDALLRNGFTQQHMISASGGTEQTRFYASVSYMDQTGTVKETSLKRYTARINVDNTIGNFKMGMNLMVGFSKFYSTNETGAGINSPLNAQRWANPYERPYDPVTGDFSQTGGGPGRLTSAQPNPATELFLSQRYFPQTKGVGTVYLEYNVPFVKGLSARTNWGGDYTYDESTIYRDRRSSTGASAAGGQGSLFRQAARNFRYTITTSLNYKKNIGDHDIEAGVYHEVLKNDSRNISFTGYGLTNGLPNEGGITAGNGTNGFIPAVGGGGSQNGIFSYFTTINYGYKNKYFINLSGRRDGSSRFGQNNRYANFGSVGAVWVVKNEAFMANQKLFSDLRLRVSYGTTGNQITSAGDFGFIPLLARANYAGASGFTATAGNADYKWETNRTANIALEFGLLKGRVSGTLELYNRKTKDLFFDQPISGTAGVLGDRIPGNLGTLQNQGVEFMLRADVIKTKDFRWTIEGNFTYNQNKVLSLPTDSVDDLSGIGRLIVGKPINNLYLVRYAGVNPDNGAPLFYNLDGKTTTETYNDNLRTYLGTADAPYFGGFSTTVAYKGFDLSAQVNFFLGRILYNNEYKNLMEPSYYTDNLHTDRIREWRNPGDQTEIPGFQYGILDKAENSSWMVDNGDFWRLRNVMLGYTFSKALTDKMKIKSFRVFLQGQNVWTSSKVRSFDPEITGQSLSGAFYPALIQGTFGISVGF
ncbi:MAG: SusC/RagA family TonB-linked outer membrane protein [Bacteroidota bacterium]|nr:SusC/RagA family TonB-linked outer membrane protein [Bacteroidota bacterium]